MGGLPKTRPKEPTMLFCKQGTSTRSPTNSYKEAWKVRIQQEMNSQQYDVAEEERERQDQAYHSAM